MLLTLLIYLLGLVGASQANSYGGLMAARLTHGLASGVCEALPVQLVNDIFFCTHRQQSWASQILTCRSTRAW